MIVNLIKSKQMFSLTLPQKVKGQYWLTDVDKEGNKRQLIRIEAVAGEWVLKSNKKVSILDGQNGVVEQTVLNSQGFFNLQIKDEPDRVVLFAESIDVSRQTFWKIVVKNPSSFRIGRSADNEFRYENGVVSGKHAQLSFDGTTWSIQDMDSTNGTYVNGYRVSQRNLRAGDCIYIMGLKMIVGHSFLAVNNPDGLLKIQAQALLEYLPQVINAELQAIDEIEKKYFYRSPRFHREIKFANIQIDPPPQPEKMDTVPLALMLGPSLTMAMTSVSTGVLTVSNVISSGGEMRQALPTLIMSVSMLLGTVLWPILTKKYEKKQKLINEKKRQDKYLAYLDGIRDDIRRECKEQSDILHENIVSLEECSSRIAEARPKLWERSIGQDDFLRLRLGKGELPLYGEVKFPEKRFTMQDDHLQDAMLSLGNEPKTLNNVPISVSLVDNTTIGICGTHAMTINLLKSFILQMISLHSYDELKIMLICEEKEEKEWEFVKFIPHFWNHDKTIRFFATNADELKELSAFMDKNIVSRGDVGNEDYSKQSPYYVILSTSKRAREKCEALSQLLKYENNRGFSIVLSADALKDLSKDTKMVISLEQSGCRMYDRDDTTGKGISFEVENVNAITMNSVAKDIANIELDMSSQRYALPSMLTFLEMFNVSKIEHLNSLTRWKENNPTITLETPIGVDSYGESFGLDLHEKYHGPHGLVAGMTGSGKSEFIITYILSLAVNFHPDEVAFILIDYKGGGLTGAFEDSERGVKLPHLAGTITNLDGASVKRSLISIQSELRRRQAIFNEARKVSNEGTMDIYKYQQLYRDKVVKEPVPHLFIISDEFAELKTQQPEFMEQLISAARIGRSLGVHLILATQKPSGVVDDQIWSNSKFRVCLKVQEKADSQDMIKCPDAAELSQTGRFYLQVGYNELFALGQSAWCGAEYIPTETVEKSIDSSIQVVDNLGRVVMNVKPGKKKSTSGSIIKQIVSIVKYLSDLATEENVSVRPLWLEPISSTIYVDDLEEKYGHTTTKYILNPVIGEYDDPFNQKQGLLTVPFSSEGNCLIYGATGNGKTTFLTSLAYSLLKNHTSEELNLYIMDFGSETLKVFEHAPQVGGVVILSEEEKLVNLIKMLQQEVDKRKGLFSEFGGDYAGYSKNSGNHVPNIVVMLNNYAGFTEQFEDLQDALALLTRDGVKYGIYFAITATGVSDVRYKTQQNFRQMFTMQLNDATDYSMIVGKTEGLIPSKHKGRGLVALERAYEFQTAYCKADEDTFEFLRQFCTELEAKATTYAKTIPVLPNVVNYQHVKGYVNTLEKVPIGIRKQNLNVATINLGNRVIYPITAQETYGMRYFVEEFVNILSHITNIVVVDTESVFVESNAYNLVQGVYETFVQKLFAEMVERNNAYKDANLDVSVLEKYKESVYVIVGFKRFYEQLTADGREKLELLLEKAESFYKIHFVIVESVSEFGSYTYSSWYKRHVSGSDGLWIGDGIADQYLLKINKITSELYEEVGDEYGYLLNRNRPSLIKVLSSLEEEGE